MSALKNKGADKGLRVRLNMAFAAIGLLFVLTIALSFYLFDDLTEVIDNVEKQAFPNMLAAMQISQRSALIAASAPALAEAMSLEELEQRRSQLAATLEENRSSLARITFLPGYDTAQKLRTELDDMSRIETEMSDLIRQRLELTTQRQVALQEIRSLQQGLQDVINPIQYGTISLARLLGQRVARRTTRVSENLVNETIDRWVGARSLVLSAQAFTEKVRNMLDHSSEMLGKTPIARNYLCEHLDTVLALADDEATPTDLTAKAADASKAAQSSRALLDCSQDPTTVIDLDDTKLAQLAMSGERISTFLQAYLEDANQSFKDTWKMALTTARQEIGDYTDLVLDDLRVATDIKAESSLILSLLTTAVNINNKAALTPLENEYDRSFSTLHEALQKFNLSSLAERNPVLRSNASRIHGRFIAINESPNNLFEIHRNQLDLQNNIEELIKRAHSAAAELSIEVDRLVSDVQIDMRNQIKLAAEGQRSGSLYLLLMSVASILFLLLIAIATTRALQARETALSKAKTEAEQASLAKSVFLANMSHEIRTPLNAVLGLTHLLQSECTDGRQRDRLDKISASGHHLLSVINNILDISKIEAGRLQIRYEDFEIRTILERVCKIMCPRADEKSLEIVYDLAPELEIPLRGDAHRLDQILLNLVGNAIKFTDHGEVRVTAAAAEVSDESILVRFEVHDTGLGISTGAAKRLFEPFEQIDSTRTRRFEGTGLGLAISRRLAEQMGGEIGVDSALGEGSCFWFTARLPRASVATLRSWRNIGLKNRRVLVVDDLSSARDVLTGMLRHFGMNAQSAASGAEALMMVEQADHDGAPFEILMLDWQMPEMDGIETAQRLAGLTLSHRPSHLLVTAFGDHLPTDSLHQGEFKCIIPKPVTPSALHDVLLEILSERAPPATTDPSYDPDAAEQELRRNYSGTRTLLVEDNVVNREVALDLLRSVGLEMESAENGRKAIELAERVDYALILMDIQMPVMDGIEATKALRASARYRSVPILAMTANAFDEDREQCLAVGMNDHISKPVVPAELYKKILQWLAKTGTGQHRNAPTPPAQQDSKTSVPAKTEGKPAYPPELDIDAGIRNTGDNPAIYHRVLGIFSTQHRGDMQKLRDALATGSQTEAKRLVHSLKGASATIGANELSADCARLEVLISQNGSHDDMEALSYSVEERYDSLVDALQDTLTKSQ